MQFGILWLTKKIVNTTTTEKQEIDAATGGLVELVSHIFDSKYRVNLMRSEVNVYCQNS